MCVPSGIQTWVCEGLIATWICMSVLNRSATAAGIFTLVKSAVDKLSKILYKLTHTY